jgi:hypothetical protein
MTCCDWCLAKTHQVCKAEFREGVAKDTLAKDGNQQLSVLDVVDTRK